MARLPPLFLTPNLNVNLSLPTARPDFFSLPQTRHTLAPLKYLKRLEWWKDYCLTEPAWEPAVDVLDADRGSGWGLATALLQARGTAASNFERRGGGGYGDYGEDEDGREGGPGEAKGVSMSMASTRGVLSLPYFTGAERR